MKIYNTLSQQKEDFQPLVPGRVGMYVCGPTVYGLLHIGNYRGVVFFNLVRNWFESKGYEVNYVYNFTDVDDKIIERSRDEGLSAGEIAEKYIAEFKKDYDTLKLRPHTANPRVTENMDAIIAMIRELVDKEMAYQAQGDVFYRVRRFNNYGKLSHRNVDELLSGARVEASQVKEDPLDFALWKAAKPGEPSWQSPWGPGRPGWHIECSAMSEALLGPTFDIHGGGSDLIFPHHENEIAQSEGCHSDPYVRYWMHNNMLTFSGQKMSKSLGNILTGRQFLEQYNGEILKYLMLSSHYRSILDFSPKKIHDVIAGLNRIYTALAWAQEASEASCQTTELAPQDQKRLNEFSEAVKMALDDDFNTPVVFAEVFDLVRWFNSLYKRGQKIKPPVKAASIAFLGAMKPVGAWMNLFEEPAHKFLEEMKGLILSQKGLKEEDVTALVEQRRQARSDKDFQKADEIRDRLVAMGIEIYDTPQGTEWWSQLDLDEAQ